MNESFVDALQNFPPSLARRIINRVRDGTVPLDGLDLLTSGREPWLASLKEDLELVESGDSRLRIFNGRYGDGKTHLMRLFEHMALRQGFVTSYVTITRDIPLNRWDHLYRAIVRALRTGTRPDRPGLTAILDPNDPDPSIAPHFSNRAEQIRKLPTLHPDFATAIYRLTTRQGTAVDEQQDLLTLRNWLEGQPISVRILRPLSITAAIDRHSAPAMLYSMVATLRYFGMAGVVLLLDEIESTLDQSARVRSHAYENLRLFIDRDSLPPYSLLILSATPEMFTDAERGFISYPALWRRLRDVGSSERVNYRATLVDLTKTPLTSNDLFRIASRIRKVHSIALQWEPESRVGDEYLRQAATFAAGGQLSLIFSPTGVFVKLISAELDLAEQSSSYIPRPELLPKRFQEIDLALQQAYSHEQWAD